MQALLGRLICIILKSKGKHVAEVSTGMILHMQRWKLYKIKNMDIYATNTYVYTAYIHISRNYDNEFKIMLTSRGVNETSNFFMHWESYFISYTGNDLLRYFLIILSDFRII